jgi:4-hydroxybutyrate CoA-transferase
LSRIVSAERAVQAVKPGMRIRFPVGHSPTQISDLLAARVGELADMEMSHTAAQFPFLWFGPGFEDTFGVVHEHYAGRQNWSAMKERRHDYLPVPFSLRFKGMQDGRDATEHRGADVLCIEVSPPDARGMVNLGPSVWEAPRWIEHADIVLAEVVPNMPVMCGDGTVSVDDLTYLVEGAPKPSLRLASFPSDENVRRMAEHVASLISDGDTLEIGAGMVTFGIAAMLVELLRDRNNLGWHSEATPPEIPQLIASGVIDSSRVTPHVGSSAAANWLLLDEDVPFAERNPSIQAREVGRITDPRIVASIPGFKAINTAILVDLSGQAAAESVGSEMHGGTGGLLEFIVGALWSPGGRSIIALPATDPSGTRSRIVGLFPEGTQGTVPRTLADTVVTEHGIARLWGKSVRERAAELISVADPQFREELEAEARKLYYP